MKEKLFEACDTGNFAAIKLMFKKIDLAIPYIEILNAFEVACANGELEIVEFFFN